MSSVQAFTKSFLDGLTPPENRSRTYYKDSNSGLLRLSLTQNGVKSFFVQKKVNGRSIRVTLGRYPELSIHNARKKASEAISKLSMGVNPIEEKRSQLQQGVTLNQAFTDYLSNKRLKPNTHSNYETIMAKYLADWANQPLKSITRKSVLERFESLSEISPSSANKTMRVLRAIFNYSMGLYEDANGMPIIESNPVDKLTQLKRWNSETRRNGYIRQEDLNNWVEGVLELYQYNIDQDVAIADYLIVTLLTGLRRNEVLRLHVDNLDVENKLFTVRDTKNGRPHALPLIGIIGSILTKRASISKNGYLFESRVTGRYIKDFRRQLNRVREVSGIEFTSHDLRRTFATYAQACEIPELTIKRLLNHKEKANVTLGYIVENVHSLIKPLKLVSDYVEQNIDPKNYEALISASTWDINSEASRPK